MKKNFSKIWKLLFYAVILGSALAYAYAEYNTDFRERQSAAAYNIDLYRMLEWLRYNTKESDVILTQWTLAPFIYGLSDRNVIATTKVYPSEVDIVGERYADLARFFFSANEEDALEIARKYNASYVVVPINFDFESCGYIGACGSLELKKAFIFNLIDNSGLENIKLIKTFDNFKVYKILAYPSNRFSLSDYVYAETKKFLESKKINIKNIDVVGSIMPHDIYHSSQIIIGNLALTSNKYDKIVILGPDHLSRAGYPISTSDISWPGFYGDVMPDFSLIKKLGIQIDNGAHSLEWSISTLIPFVNYWNPDATIVPILFRADTSYNDADNFGKRLSRIIDENTLVIASIDFSHVTPGNQKINFIEDQKSLEALEKLEKSEVYSLVTEGKPVLVAFLSAMEEKNAKKTSLLNISSQTYQKLDSTISVGYISLHYAK